MESSNNSSFPSPPQAAPADAFGRLLDPAFLNLADAEIVLAAAGAGDPVGIHRCILAAKSAFFLDRFSHLPTAATAGEKTRLELAKLVPGGHHIGRDALVAVLGYLYTGRLKPPPQEAAVCVDDACAHEACRPAIDFVVESTYAASGFQISELVSFYERRLSGFLNMALDEDVVPIVRVAFTCQLGDLLNQCIRRVEISALDSWYLEKELPDDIYGMIKRMNIFHVESDNVILDPEHEKRVRNIQKALDSDDIDLVDMLIRESAVNLDDAFAIHYAAAYCEPKVLAELLKLNSANVNLKNRSGYTPLHVACIRREPDIIPLLVEKGASVLERTPDGRDALTICRRLTRQKDMNRELKKGQERSNAYLCIDFLEQTKRTFTLDLVVRPLLIHNFLIRILDLENRVAFAKVFYPSEAQLAMRIAEADSTDGFAGTIVKENCAYLLMSHISGTLHTETSAMHRRLRERLDALTETVELGRRSFPNCFDFLDKFLNEEATNLALLESDNPEDQRIKRARFYELRGEAQKVFDKDKAACAAKAPPETSSLFPSSSQGAGASESADASAPSSGPSSQPPNAGTASGQLEPQGDDVMVDGDVGVGSKRKMRSVVWDEFASVKIGDDWRAECMWCHKSLSACTKNGTNHLRRHLKICQSRQATKGLK